MQKFTAGAPAGTAFLAFDGDTLCQPGEQSSTPGLAGSHHQTQPEAGAGGLSADAFTTPGGLLRPAISHMQAATGVWASSSQQVHLLAPVSWRLTEGSLPAQEQSSAAGPAGSHHQTQPEAGAGGLSADAFTTPDGLLRPAISHMQAATGASAKVYGRCTCRHCFPGI